jgi:hypothetical protein
MPDANQYLIRADEPYKGRIENEILPNGTVAFTDGLTPLRYSKTKPYPLKVITSEELDRLQAEYEESRCTAPEPITEESWFHALEVLPPCRWEQRGGCEFFHVSEAIDGRLVNWFARNKRGHWTFVDLANATWERLTRKMKLAGLAKGTRIRANGFEGTVVALPGDDPSVGHVPPSMVCVHLPGGRCLVSAQEVELLAETV